MYEVVKMLFDSEVFIEGFWGNFALSWVELEEINFKTQLGEVYLSSPSVRRRV